MPAHEFEKSVQQKMENLKISPSAAVWNTVEVEIRRNKRRRRILLALPLLLLVILGTFWVLQQSAPSTVVQTEKNASYDKEHASAGTSATGLSQTSPAEQDNSQPGHLNPADSNQPPQTASGTQPEQAPLTTATSPTDKPQSLTTGKSPQDRAETTFANNTLRKSNRSGHIDKRRVTRSNHKFLPSGKETTTDRGLVTSALNSSTEKDILFADRIGLEKLLSDRNAVKASPLIIARTVSGEAAEKTIKLPVASKWHWGITANIGTSKLVDGTLKGAFDKSLAPATSSYLIDPNSAMPGPVGLPSLAPNPSSVKPGISLGIGAFVKRDLGTRWSISAGIEYNYYTTQIKVGEKVDSNRIVNTSNATLNVDRFYKNDEYSRYNNKYHFIEVPISAEYLFNKNMPVPFSVFGGVTVGYLHGTNALQYDHFYGVYYRDDKSFNRTQFGVHTGVRFQITRHGRQALEIGPVFNYKLNSMSNDNSGNTSHLLSGAVNLRWHLR